MFEAIINFFKRLFSKTVIIIPEVIAEKEEQRYVEKPLVTDGRLKDHPMMNFISVPVIYFEKNIADPYVGICSTVAYNDDNEPVAVIFDYIRGREVFVKTPLFQYSHSWLRNIMNMSMQERLVIIHQNVNIDKLNLNPPVIMTFEEIHSKLQINGFYKTADMYFRLVKTLET